MVNLLGSSERTADGLVVFVAGALEPYQAGILAVGAVVLVVLGLVYARQRGEKAGSTSNKTAPVADEPVDTEPAPVGAPAQPVVPLPESSPKVQSVSLSEIVHEMIEDRGDRTSYLNRRSFDIVQLTEEQVTALENAYAEEHGNVEIDPQLRKQFDAGDLLELPSKYETQEFSLRERFCDELASEKDADQLRGALRASEAFREFEQVAGKLGVRDKWEHYRDRAFEELAVDWLDDHNIPYDDHSHAEAA